MASHLNGLATNIHQEPKGLFVHCAAHTVNSCLQECGKQCKVIRDANEIGNFIILSPKCLLLFEAFEHMQNESDSEISANSAKLYYYTN